MASSDPEKARYEVVRKLFDRAHSLAPGDRESFVRREAGGDGALADEVLRLLRAHQDTVPPGDSESRISIGPYRILSTLGEGGMGTVYLAEQREPIRRRVALKVLKRGMDSKAFLVRFEAERQALAMMEHTSIARVYDAGVTESGQPYLVMEYVKGIPITNYCDDHQLSIASRIELFVAVCSAVQHAHTKGVMHRDLKPSNILVAVQDGHPVPKIIDFGLAKAVDHRLVQETVFTEVGQILGTPEYMSPEQAGVGGLDIDTRTDVFSLGVLLYQLLTGTLPVTREELLRHGYFEMQRVIREDEMQKPSTKVTTLGDGAEAYAKARNLPLGELQKALRGELDWIVMKAIEKDRQRRYTTAHELAVDLLRHLKDEPVSAGPPSTAYVLKKLARRYRGVVAAACGIVGALAFGLGLAVWQWREAEANAETARRAEAGAVEQRTRAENNYRNYRLLRSAVELDQFLAEEPGLWPEGDDAASKRMQDWLQRVDAWSATMPDHGAAIAELRTAGRAVDGRWVFADGSVQFLHDALAGFVESNTRFRAPDGVLLRVRDAAAWSAKVRHVTIEEHAESWQQLNRRLTVHPFYGGMTLSEQVGLVPLGPDPESKLEEFWFARSLEVPQREGGKLRMDAGTGIVLVLVPGGNASIGSDPGPMVERVEQPRRQVALKPFFLGKYELTQAQWTAWAGANPSKYRALVRPEFFGNSPVESVSWLEVHDVLLRRGLQMPTEAQWEYACRAGTTTPWSFGPDRESLRRGGIGIVNIADGFEARAANKNYMPEAVFWPDYDDRCVAHEVVGGRYPPNAWGFHEMHGNVAEFTRGFVTSSYADVEFAPGDGAIVGPYTEWTVVRGGSFWKRVEDARSSTRIRVAKDGKYDNVGVRVCRQVDS